MSKKAFVPTRPAMPRSKPVRVNPKPPAAQSQKVSRNIVVMVAVPALIFALLGVLFVFWKSRMRRRGRPIGWGELESTRRAYLRELDEETGRMSAVIGVRGDV